MGRVGVELGICQRAIWGVDGGGVDGVLDLFGKHLCDCELRGRWKTGVPGPYLVFFLLSNLLRIVCGNVGHV